LGLPVKCTLARPVYLRKNATSPTAERLLAPFLPDFVVCFCAALAFSPTRLWFCRAQYRFWSVRSQNAELSAMSRRLELLRKNLQHHFFLNAVVHTVEHSKGTSHLRASCIASRIRQINPDTWQSPAQENCEPGVPKVLQAWAAHRHVPHLYISLGGPRHIVIFVRKFRLKL